MSQKPKKLVRCGFCQKEKENEKERCPNCGCPYFETTDIDHEQEFDWQIFFKSKARPDESKNSWKK